MEQVISPNITLYPIWEGEVGASPVSLVCTLSEFFPGQLNVRWLLDGLPLTTTPTERKLQRVEGEEKTFSLSSQVKLDTKEWKKGPNVTCESTHNTNVSTRSINTCQSKWVYLCMTT